MEAIAGVVAAEVSYDPEPAVGIVSELATASIEIVRVAEVADSHIVVSPVHLYSRSFILRSCRHGERGYRQQSCENADGRERRVILRARDEIVPSVSLSKRKLADLRGDFVTKM